ncbi:NADH-quinone oxidoreductase subunit L [candidate division WOR-3 bacterium]|nr:NADH-quinone oxidoreductase subunit L [candidate division WOR-3 bacterium]
MNWILQSQGFPILVILIPIVGALLAFAIRPIRRYVAILSALATGYFALRLFLGGPGWIQPIPLPEIKAFGITVANSLQADGLSNLILLLISGFAVFIFIYSFYYKGGPRDDWKFFTFALLTYGAANGVALAGSVYVLYFFWGVLLVTVYGLLFYGRGDVEGSARKMFLLNGVADFILLLGLLLLVIYTKDQGAAGQLSYGHAGMGGFKLDSALPILSFVCIGIGALTKAGSFPMHTWIPKAAETAPAQTMAYIPASLDKLLGIYLFVRLCYSLFDISSNTAVQVIFLTIGAVTVLAAVFMALIQKDAIRLLSYHAVSQVGYMILGIASGTLIGIAGGLFHMMNHAIYKSTLFLAGGAVAHRSGETDLNKLGGLARTMPLTFFSFLVAALAISGIPPLNGFFSKWLVYQSFVEMAKTQPVFILFMIAGMFGSVLTLASFLKLTHGIFLGRRPESLSKVKEVGFTKWFPPLVLALVCIAFGVFAYRLPIRYLISPALPAWNGLVVGWFQPLQFVGFIILLVSVGFLIYLAGRAYAPRTRKVFIGAEELTETEMHYSGPHFYSSLKDIKLFNEFYRFASGGSFDIFHYIQGIGKAAGKTLKQLIDETLNEVVKFVRYIFMQAGGGLSRLQTGGLQLYLGWVFLGILILIILLLGGGGNA